MRIYITRHGQVDLNAEYFNNDISLPKGEVSLSELGRQQATLLGKRMKEWGFSGAILASPHLRTMETAELVAKQTGSAIIPTPWLHEIFLDKNEIEVFKGCNAKDLQKFFPHVIENVSMEAIWWATMVENREMVYERVLKGITEYLKSAKEDILLVGHAVSIGAVLDYFHLREDGLLWNCCLSRYDTNHLEYNFFNDVTFLPEHMVSSNKVMRMDIDSV